MFVGHYSSAFVAKAFAPRVPMWVLLLAAQLVDVFWVAFVLGGAEHARLDPALASNPLDLYDMPITHSLLGTGLWAGAAGLVVARTPMLGGTRRAGVAVALVVGSHWFLDLLVHRPDLTLWGTPPKLGLGLWEMPLLAYLLELAFVAGSAAFCAVRCESRPRAKRGLAIAVGVLVILQTAVTFGPIPNSVAALVLSVWVVFAAVAYAGLRTERWANQSTIPR
jgi:hypothetical protein